MIHWHCSGVVNRLFASFLYRSMWLNQYARQFIPIFALLALRGIVGVGTWLADKCALSVPCLIMCWTGTHCSGLQSTAPHTCSNYSATC